MRVVIRVDASCCIGSGHVMRCLSLAEVLRDAGVYVVFITKNYEGNLDQVILSNGFEVRSLFKLEGLAGNQELDAEQTIELLGSDQNDLLVVDHYALDSKWESLLRPHFKSIFVIDDLANRKHDCDWLLDQNYVSDQTRYDSMVTIDTIKLLGPKFALLRKEFSELKMKFVRNYTKIESLLIFFGGTDSANLTSMVLKALQDSQLSHLTFDVVIGLGNSYREEVRSLVSMLPNGTFHLQVENMAVLMAKADLAIGAGGIATWERMALGLPSLVVTVAENQIPSIQALDNDNYLVWIGNIDEIDQEQIKKVLIEWIVKIDLLRLQALSGQKKVDGCGARNVSSLLVNGPDVDQLTIRKAVQGDSLLYWCWANDSKVRENAFHGNTIALDTHKKWFNHKLNDPMSTMLLIESTIGPVGQVRFEQEGSQYLISYSLGFQFRGQGLGAVILRMAFNYLKGKKAFMLIAEVKQSNRISCRIFEKLGFKNISSIRPDSRRYQWFFDPGEWGGELNPKTKSHVINRREDD
ncbi:MAG: UDP-2,4-diacetamido-2,4,6-trideoxy-beta-L-altropyranose hydrolase [Candidatus Marinimicrobia bacterium]|jgi:UDP-2,4-diacetamido-2,4,6-trideoxy-beta-L-altropyranose hydrolase|nr:UDP-2,4-diacetamido-2,4,6-trideoxy-beta-L-altropyranose hydrolase [Candidatus Neomarinimicrobiota bacterium]MBT4947017.1 UDP-2,4-diacetamido-2,4,6-trideoxy-beta-L-altropyranose hydrolase [Candidatus Neomarinimicrobiota bacterium]MBT5269626.1 UDP-2,4-diacetamido-2,4,6-trideoxy-beta-L-altropyranose hydrolase [Candidatus Neomarinimicrobiota bacterium]